MFVYKVDELSKFFVALNQSVYAPKHTIAVSVSVYTDNFSFNPSPSKVAEPYLRTRKSEPL